MTEKLETMPKFKLVPEDVPVLSNGLDGFGPNSTAPKAPSPKPNTYWFPDESHPRQELKQDLTPTRGPISWSVQIQGSLQKVSKVTPEAVLINAFRSATSKQLYSVPLAYFKEHFHPVIPDINGDLELHGYPIKININEFDKRDELSQLESKLKKTVREATTAQDAKLLETIINKMPQIRASMGAPSQPKKEVFDEIKNARASVSSEQQVEAHNLKRTWGPIINRTSRWTIPAGLNPNHQDGISYENFEKSPGYPAPLGIRPRDFAPPSETINQLKILINQLLNILPGLQNLRNEFKKKFTWIEDYDNVHKCWYSGKGWDGQDLLSGYCSSENPIEICHRDPNKRFGEPGSVYWGHGEYNRIQGGFSEEFRAKNGRELSTDAELLNETLARLREPTASDSAPLRRCECDETDSLNAVKRALYERLKADLGM